MNKILGSIRVLEVVDNPDGTATIHLDVPDETMETIKEAMGWTEWSQEKFNEFVVSSLQHYAQKVENGKANTPIKNTKP